MISSAQRRLLLLTATFALSLLSCGREVTGPENGVLGGRSRFAAVALDPQMPSLLASLTGGSSVVPFERVRVVLRREDGTVSVDTLVNFPADADSIALALLVPLPINTPEAGLPLALTMAYINAAGDTVFRGGPSSLVAAPIGTPGAGAPVVIPIRYDGVGKNAASVVVTPDTGTRVAGTSSTFSGVALDAQGQAIANTPLVWYTLDSTRASIPNAGTGLVNWLPVRGVARIVAALPGGERADTSFITVALPASKLVVASGNAQTGIVSSALAQPVVLRTLAADDVPVAGVEVTFAVATGGGSLAVLKDTSDAAGVVSTSWTLGAALGAQSITATATGLSGSPQTITATATAGAPQQVVLTQVALSGTAGAPLSPTTQAAIQDAAGNVVTTFTGSVTLSLATGAPGALSGVTTVNAVAGIANFPGITLPTVGSYTLIASSASLTPDTSAVLTIAPAAAAQLEFVQQPVGSTAGQAMAPPITVIARDAFGNVATTFTGNVTLALLNANGALLSGSTTATAVAGLATFANLSVDRIGTAYTLEASSGALTPDTSSVFGITPAEPAQIVAVSGDGQTGTAGVALAQPVVVEVRDAFGNVVPGVSLEFSALDGGTATPPTGTTDVSGRLSTTWTLASSVGVQTLRVTALATPTVKLDVTATAAAGALAQLVFTASPAASYVAGETWAPAIAVAAQDAFGNLITTFTGDISLEFAANPAAGSLAGATTVAAVNGVATFSTLSITTAGSGYTLLARSGAVTSAATGSVAITAAAPAAVTVVAGNGQSAQVATTLADSLTVRVTDAFANSIAGATVNFSSANGVAVSPASAVTDANGLAATQATLGNVAGSQTVQAIVGSFSASFTLTATPGAAAQLDVTQGDNQTAAVGTALPQPIVARVRDALGNVLQGVEVAFTLLDGDGVLSAALDTTDASGLASTVWTLGPATGLQRISASIAGGISATVNATAEAGAATQLIVTTQPVDGTAGVALNAFSLRVADALGNTVTNFVGTVTLSAQDGGAQAVPVITSGASVSVSGGIATFSSTTINSAGTFRFVANGPGLDSATTNFIVVAPAAPSTLALVSGDGQSGTVSLGLPSALSVRVTDAFGNGVSGVNVNWGVVSGLATVLSPVSTTDANGFATTGVVLDTVAGPIQISASAAGLSGSPITFTATALATTPALVDAIAGDAQSVAAGAALGTPLRVRVTDIYGNPVSGVSVSFASLDGISAFSDSTVLTDVNGEAATDATAGTTVGVKLIQATAAGVGTAPFTLTIVPAQLATLEYLAGPTSSTAGETLPDIQFQAKDQYGNIVTTYAGLATIGVETGPSSPVIIGALNVPAVDGVFTFSGLSLPVAGTYRLRANVPGIAGATPFFTNGPNVAAVMVGVGALARTLQPQAVLTDTLQVRITDVYGNVVPDQLVLWSELGGGVSLDGPSSLTDANGIAKLSLTAGNVAGTYAVLASFGSITGSPVEFAIEVSTGPSTQLVLINEPTDATAGASIPQFSVEVRDAFGNVTPSYATPISVVVESGPNTTITGSTSIAPVNGVVSFSDLSLTIAGVYQFRISGAGLTDVVSQPFTISAASPSTVVAVDGLAQTDTVGATLASPLRVRVEDAFGNPVSGVSVAWAMAGPGSVANDTTITDGSGVAQVFVTLGTVAGATTINASVDGLTGSPVVFTATATAGAPVALVVDSGDEQTAAAGGTLAQPLVVRAVDTHGNGVAGVSVTFDVGTGASAFSDTTLVTDALGTASVTATAALTAGSGNINVTSPGLISASFSVNITAASTASLAFVSGPTSATAGEALTPLVFEARDAFGNPTPAFTGAITAEIASGPVGASLTGTVTRNAVAGVVTFDDLALPLAGSYTIRATDGALLIGVSSSFDVSPTTPAALAAEGLTVRVLAVSTELTDSLRVKVTDTFGNAVPGVIVSWGVQSGTATLSAPTSTTDASGIASITLTGGPLVEAVVVEASQGALAGSPVIFNIALQPGEARQLQVETEPTTQIAGSAIGPIVISARDSTGNLVPTFTGNVLVTIDSGTVGATLGGTTTVAAVTGVATFTDLTLDLAGNYRLRLQAAGLSDTTTTVFTITAAAATTLQLVSGDAQSDTVGVTLPTPLRVRATDAFGNGVGGITVEWATTGEGSLSAATVITDADGFAEILLTLANEAVAQDVTATVAGLSGSPVTFTATGIPGSPTSLSPVVASVSAIAGGAPPNFEIAINDAFGNAVTWFTNDVTVSVLSGPGGFASGTTTRTPVAGIATFNDLALNSAGVYVLQFTSGALSVSAGLTVEAGSAATLAVVSGDGQTGFVTEALPQPLVVGLVDAVGNPVVGDTVVFTVTAGGGTLSSLVAIDTVLTDVTGRAQTTWTLGLDTTVTHTVVAERVGLPTLTFNAFPLALVANRVWTGDLNSDFADPANWRNNLVPASADSVLIPAGRTNYPILVAPIAVARLTVESGAVIDVAGGELVINGSVRNDGTILGGSSTGITVSPAVAATISGIFPNLGITSGSVSPTGSFEVSGDFVVSQSASFSNPEGLSITVGGSFSVLDNASLSMQNGETIDVTGSVTLTSSALGSGLDNGRIRVASNVTAGSSFRAAVGHVIELSGVFQQNLTLVDADSSFSATCSGACFGSIESSKVTGNVVLGSNIKALSLQISGDSLRGIGRTVIGVQRGFYQSVYTKVGKLGYSSNAGFSGTLDADTLYAFGGSQALFPVFLRPTVVLGDHALSANMLGDVIVRGGVLDIVGNATIGGQLRTEGSGQIRMTDATDSLTVNSAYFAGTTDGSFLTNGVLNVLGSFEQVGTVATYVAGNSAHTLRLSGSNPTVSMEDASLNAIGTLRISDGAAANLGPTNVRIIGDAVLEGTTSTATNGGDAVEIGGNLVDAVGFRWNSPVTRFTGANPSFPIGFNNAVYFANSVTLQDSLVVGGTVRVTTANGLLTLNGHTLRAGQFATDNGGRLSMSTAADTLVSTGSVAFEGGASVLEDGVILVSGDVLQSTTGDAVRANPAHRTVLTGTATAALNFTDPGFGAGLSYLGTLEIAKSSGNVIEMQTGMSLSGPLVSAAGGNHSLSGAGAALVSLGADVSDLTFNGVTWLLDAASISTISASNLTFTNQDLTVPQWTITGRGGAATLPNITFATAPTTGHYLVVEDSAPLDGDTVTVTMVNPTPGFSNGRVLTIDGAKLLGWAAFAAINWTNGSADRLWFNPANWAEGVVPTAGDSVIVSASEPPIINGAATVRSLESSLSLSMVLQDTLTVTKRLALPFGSTGLACTAGALKLSAADSVLLAGGIQCPVIAEQGRTVLTSLLQADSVIVRGNAVFDVDAFTLNTSGAFRTEGNGALVMDNADAFVEINGLATFGGTTAPNGMTEGILTIRGDFEQIDSPTAFQPSGNHITRFNAAQSQNVLFTHPDSSASGSHFANLQLAQDEGGVSVVLQSAVFANGQLIAINGISRSLTSSDASPRSFVSRGADVSDITTLNNVQWEIVDGADLVPNLTQLRFANMPDNQFQLAVKRGSGTHTFNSFVFDSTAANPVYLYLEDSQIGNGALSVTMLNTLPAFHANRIAVIGEAILSGWNELPLFVWTGATSNSWTTPSNWADGVVPSVSSSVTIPGTYTNLPLISSPVSVRELLLTEPSSALDLSDTLFIVDRLNVQGGASLTCLSGGQMTFVPSTTALVAGSIGCPVRIPQGTVAAEGTTFFQQALSIDSVGTFAVGDRTVALGEGVSLSITGNGVLSMEGAAGDLTVGGQAIFGGAATTGRLTAGTLRLNGAFSQLGDPASFDASATHTTLFTNSSPAQVTFANPGTSGFGTLNVDGQVQMQSDLAVRGSLDVPSGSFISGEGVSAVVATNVSGAGAGYGLRNVTLGGSWLATGTIAADTLIFTGTDIVIPASQAGTPFGYPSIAVEGTVRFTSDGTATDTLFIGGSLIVRGSGAVATLDVGANTGDSLIVFINSAIRTSDSGLLRMQEDGARVRAQALGVFQGGATEGELTAGELILEAGLTSTTANAYRATANHKTRIGGCSLCDGIPMNIAGGNVRFGSLTMANGSNSNVSDSFEADTMVMVGGNVIFPNSGSTLRVNRVLGSTPSPTLTVTTLSLGEGLSFDGGWGVDTLIMTGTGHTLPAKDNSGDQVLYNHVAIEGDIATIMANGDSLIINGGVTVRGSGRLRFNDSIDGDIVRMQSLRTRDSGIILMLDPNTLVRVTGDVTFAGGDETGWLSDGELIVQGGFTQLNNGPLQSTFIASGNHRVVFESPSSTVLITNPADSRFANLRLRGETSLTLQSDLVLDGALVKESFPANNVSIAAQNLGPAAPYTIRARGSEFSGGSGTRATFRNVALRLEGDFNNGGGSFSFSDITFADMDPTATYLDLQLQNYFLIAEGVDFSTPVVGGKYFDLPFVTTTVAFQSSTPAIGCISAPENCVGPRYEPAPPQAITWTGTTSSDWSDPNNWSTHSVPPSWADIVVPSGTTFPLTVTSARTMRDLSVAAGATMNINATTLTMKGTNLNVGGTILHTGSGSILMNPPGEPVTISGGGGMSAALVVGAPSLGSESTITFTAPMTIGNVFVNAGTLVLNGQWLVTGELVIDGSGRLQMTNANDSLQANNVQFKGGSTEGLLTAGKLVVFGGIVQSNNPTAFAADPGHRTTLVGLGKQFLSFANPGLAASRFGTLEILGNNFTDTLSLETDIAASGQVLAATVRTIASSEVGTSNRRILAGGFNNTNGFSYFSDVRLETNGAFPFVLGGNFAFSAMRPDVVQLSIAANGGLINTLGVTFTPLGGGDTGNYLALSDLLDDGDTLRMNLFNRSPDGHEGRLILNGGARVIGWDQFPLYTFTGAVSGEVTNPANWDVGVVPTGISQVFVSNASGNTLEINAPTFFKSFSTGAGATVLVQEPLTTAGALGGFTVTDGSITCSGNGRLVINDPGPGPIFLRGNQPGCDFDMLGGNINMDGTTARFRKIRLAGGSVFIEGTLHATDSLVTSGGVYIGMTEPTDSIVVEGNARIAAFANETMLEKGNLSVWGDLEIESAASALWTAPTFHVALGRPDQSGGSRTVRIASDVAQQFDSLTVYDGFTNIVGRLSVGRRLTQATLANNVLTGDSLRTGFNIATGPATWTSGDGAEVRVKHVAIFGSQPVDGIFTPDTVEFWGTFAAENGGIQRIRSSNAQDVNFGYKLVRVLGLARMDQVPTGIPLAYEISGNLEVGETGTLLIGDFVTQDTVKVQVNGDLLVRGGGAYLGMTAPSIVTADSAHFEGGFTSQLQSGRLVVRSLVQAGPSSVNVVANDTHVLDVIGGGSLSIDNFDNNPLNVVRFAGGATTFIRSSVRANGGIGRINALDGVVTLEAGSLAGIAQNLVLGGTDFAENNSGLLLRNVALTMQSAYPEPGGAFTLNNVTFRDMEPSATFIKVLWSGTNTETWNNINFDAPVFAGGRYFDFATGDAGSSITFTNVTPQLGCFETSCLPTNFEPNNFPSAFWTGAAGTAWNDPANWSTNAVPNAGTDVTIQLSINPPLIEENKSVRSLVVNSGATLTIDSGDTLSVYGAVQVDGTVSGNSLQSTLRMIPQYDPINLSAEGAINTRLAIGSGVGGYSGVVQMNGRVNLLTSDFNSGLYMTAGQLRLSGNTLNILGSFRNFGQSTWLMNNPLDTMIVKQNFEIRGGSTEGLLTEGEIIMSGVVFRQYNTNSASSFAASGNHSTRLSGGDNSMDVWFESPDSTLSRFANLALDRSFNQWVFFDYTPVFVTNLTKVSGKNEVFSDGGGLGSDGQLIVTGSVSNVDPSHSFEMYGQGFVKLLGVNQETCDGLQFNVLYSLVNFQPLACHSPTFSWAQESGTAPVTSYGAYSASDTEIWIVGADGAIQFGDGTSWQLQNSGTPDTLFAVHGTSATDVWAVGVAGTVTHWDGSSWTASTQGSETLRGVFAFSSTEAYAVGDNGTILRWDGSSWTSMSSGTTENLTAIFAKGASSFDNDLLATGSNGTVLRLASGSWGPVSSGTSANLTGTYGSNSFGYLVVGAGGTMRVKYSFFGGSFFDALSPTSDDLNGAGGRGDVGFAVGANGTIVRLLGENLVFETNAGSAPLYAVTVTPNGTAYVAGTGVIYRGTVNP